MLYEVITPNDFTGPVSFDVFAENGSHVAYAVTVIVAAPPGTTKSITAFSLADPVVTGVIDQASNFISVVVPSGTDRTALTAVFATDGVSVEVGGVLQESSYNFV